MKIILVRQKGTTRQLSLSRRRAAVLAALAGVLFSVATVAAVRWVGADRVDETVVQNWQARLQEQDTLVRKVQEKASAQNTAVGRQLADMRARLLRIEALGAHVTQAAQIPAEEFDFSQPPAQGGPVLNESQALAGQDLQSELEQLAEQLRRRETELSILDSVLANQDLHASAEVAGRPVTWGWMSSPYGNRVDPISGKPAWHAGVDFAGREGSDVIAVASGVVTYAGARSGFGNMIEIAHANGLVTRYAHHKEMLVSAGDVVKKGQPIAVMGSTGRSTGPHVHFEVLKNGRHVDPATFVARRR